MPGTKLVVNSYPIDLVSTVKHSTVYSKELSNYVKSAKNKKESDIESGSKSSGNKLYNLLNP